MPSTKCKKRSAIKKKSSSTSDWNNLKAEKETMKNLDKEAKSYSTKLVTLKLDIRSGSIRIQDLEGYFKNLA